MKEENKPTSKKKDEDGKIEKNKINEDEINENKISMISDIDEVVEEEGENYYKEAHHKEKYFGEDGEFDYRKKKRKQSFVRSVNASIAGIMYTFKSERNMKFHYLVSFLVLILSLFFNFSKLEFMQLLGAITLVVVAEMINTAVEKTVDLVTKEYHELAKIAKDVAAGAVLVSALYAVVVAYFLFYKKLSTLTGNLVYRIRESELHITLICIVIVLIAVVVVKAITLTGTPLKGGMPSGHAALAFALATSLTLMTERVEASSLAYLMAFLVAQSRIEGKIHTFWETMAGGMLGTLVAIVIFQLGLFY